MDESLVDDGLSTLPVGPWSQTKYKLIKYYADMFSTGMKYKWDYRVYVDLFSGAGWARIRASKKIVQTSPMLALNVKDPFDKYIFCEIDEANITALMKRVEREYPSVDVSFVKGDVNERIEDVVGIVSSIRESRILTFCFVDPFKVANLCFATIESLSRLKIDFLVLIPTYMDAVRNLALYSDKANTNVERFLGNTEWRGEWNEAKNKGSSFSRFLVEAFYRSMQSLGYLSDVHSSVIVRCRNRPLYHLAFFSRNVRGMEFWKKSREGSDPQRSLFSL